MNRYQLTTIVLFTVILLFTSTSLATAPEAVLSSTKTVTVGQNATFDGSNSYDPDLYDFITEYEWTIPDEAFYVSGQGTDTLICKFTPATPTGTTYSVKLRVKDNYGVWSHISGDGTICQVTVNAAGSNWYVSTDGDDDNDGQAGSYASIQVAIDAAVYGDTVYISEGTYFQNIDFKGKNIIVKSTDPADPNIVASTIINGDGFHPVVSFDGTEDPNSILAGLTITSGIPEPNLVSYWKLDESDGNSVECALGNYDGTTYGDPNWFSTEGLIDGALQFDGIDDYVVIDGYKGILGSQSRTVSAWIKTTNVEGRIISWGTEVASGNKWLVRIKDCGNSLGAIRAEVNNGYIYGTTKINDDKWHHIAVVYDNSISTNIEDVQLFVDGIRESGCISSSQTIDTDSNSNVEIGEYTLSANSVLFDGLIDDVRIYDRALASANITDLFESSGGGLAAYWKLDESSGDAIDSFGTNDGTLNGTPTWQSSGGVIGGALEFDGVDDYVEASGYDGISGTSDRAVSAWIKTSVSGGCLGNAIISWGEITTIGKRWALVVHHTSSSGATVGAIRVALAGGYAIGSTVINDGMWHHVAAVLASNGSPAASDIKIYVDGKEDTISAILEPSSGINTGIDQNVRIAAMEDLYGFNFFDGLIDDVRIYGRALSATETRTLYSNDGGGIRGDRTEATILNCLIKDNEADYGGGIYALDGVIDGCTVINNEALDGGGIADCNGVITNSIIADNTAESHGGGLVDCLGDVINCTIAGNTATFGAGFSYCEGTIANSIIWGNEPNQLGDSSDPNYSCIEDWTTGGTGNISSDPLFVGLTDPNDPNSCDYHLSWNSPCIDKGDPYGNYLYQVDIDGQDRVVYSLVDIGADEVYDERYTIAESLPFLTSFETYQGYDREDPNLTLADGWMVSGNGSVAFAQCNYWVENSDPNDPNLVPIPYQYVNIDPNTSGIVFVDDEESDHSYIRINCIPTDGLKINLMFGGSKVASVSFGEQSNDNIYVLDNGSYQNTSTSYQSIVSQCNDYFNDPCSADSYDDIWVDLMFSIDWTNATYDVSWTNYNNTSGALIKSNASFNDSYEYLTGIMFDNASDPVSFKLNRISITDEGFSGGVFGLDDDINIVSPTGKKEEGTLTGRVVLEGSVWYDKLGQYYVKSCPTDLDPDDTNSWTIVDRGINLIRDDAIGHWETSAYNNGSYLLKMEIYNDIGLLHASGNIQRRVYFNQSSKDVDSYFSVAGRQKAQTFHHQEKPDISVKWPGQFPFELTRTYNNNLRKQIYPFFYGWTHNHNIRITENAKSDWLITNDPNVPDGDINQLGISQLWFQTAGGTRLFECDNNTSTQSDPNVIYNPIDNLGGYITRSSEVIGTDPNGDPNVFDVDYIFYSRDGLTMELSGRVESTYSNSTEGIVDWTIHAKVDKHSDRFGNALLYTWLVDQNSNYPKYITKIENNRTSARIEFENDFDFFGTDVDLYSKAKLIVGTEQDEEILRTINYNVEAGIEVYSGYWDEGHDGFKYDVTRTGDCIVEADGDVEENGTFTYPEYNLREYWYESQHDEWCLSIICEQEWEDSTSVSGTRQSSLSYSQRVRVVYDEVGRIKLKGNCISLSPTGDDDTLESGYWGIASLFDYSYDSSGNLVTTENFYDAKDEHNISTCNHRHLSKAVSSVKNEDGAVISQMTVSYPEIQHWGTNDLGHYQTNEEYGEFGNYVYDNPVLTAVKNFVFMYTDQDNPFKPSTTYEYFDGYVRRNDSSYNSFGDIITQKVSDADPNYPSDVYVGTEWAYHLNYGFETRKTTWQGYCQDDTQGDIVPSGAKVETLNIFGDADGTVDETDGKYLVQQKKLLDDLGTSGTSDDVWAVTYYEYYDNGLLKKKTGPEGSVTYVEYHDSGAPKKVWLDATFDASGDPNSVLNKRYCYDEIGKLLIEADLLGSVTVNSYDSFGRKYKTCKYIDPNVMDATDAGFTASRYEQMEVESVVSYGFDNFDRLTHEKSAAGGEKKIDYDRYGRVWYETYDDLSEMQLYHNNTYHSLDLVYEKRLDTKTNGQLTEYYMYDNEQRLIGKRSENSYDLWVDFGYEIIDYYGSGLKKSEKVFNTNFWTDGVYYSYARYTYRQKDYYYDHLDRVTQTVIETNLDDPNNSPDIITDYGYDASGNRTYVIDPNYNVIFTDYDNANRKVREYFAVTPSFYSGTSNIDIDTTKTNAVVRREVEYFNNDKIKNVTSYDYDTDILAYSEFKYDGLGRITETAQMVDDANNIDAVTSIAYYDEGIYLGSSSDPNIIRDNTYHIKVTDAEGKDTYVGLTAFGKRARTLYPSGDIERLEYNGDNTLARRAVWDANDVQYWIDYKYDSNGKMTAIDYPDTQDVNDVIFEYDYDAAKRVIKVIDRRYLDNVDQLAESEGDIYEFDYDALNNIRSYTYTPYGDPNTWTVEYEYGFTDSQKHRITVIDPNDDIIYDVYYDYDGAGRLTDVSDVNDLLASFDYDLNGNRSCLTYTVNNVNAVTMNYSYNIDNMLTGITTGSIETIDPFAFSFDASTAGDIDGLGRLVSASETVSDTSASSTTHDLSYSYDGMGQLLSASVSNIGGSAWSIGYNYGKDGNISSMTVGGSTVNFEYDSDNDGTDDSDLMTKIGNDSLGWNFNGNLDNSVTASFTYDWDNKLRYAVSGDDTVEIRYDPRGNRIFKSVDDGTNVTERKYIVDIVGKLPVILCEIDSADCSLTNSYIYANSQIIAQDAHYQVDPNDAATKGFDRYFYLHDRLGSVRMVLDVMPIPDLHWRFDETSGDIAYDSMGTGISDANLINGPAHVTGKYGNAVDLDGANDYLWSPQYPNNPNGDSTSSHTYAAWFKTTGTDGTIMCWGDPNDHGGVLGVYTSGSDGVIGISVYDGDLDQTGYILGTTDVSDGQWHHVAVVLRYQNEPIYDEWGFPLGYDTTDVTEVVLYVDGDKETISASQSLQIETCGFPLLAGAVGDPNNPTFIEYGAYPDPNDPANYGMYFDGQLDDIRVYNRILDIGQIRKLANTENYIKIKASYTYNPYGEDFDDECETQIENPFKYTGQWYDAEIAQYYLRARMYDPQLMRFTARDPIFGKFVEPLTLHKYLYCNNDSINRIDPDGKIWFMAARLIIGAVANAAGSHASGGNARDIAIAGIVGALNAAIPGKILGAVVPMFTSIAAGYVSGQSGEEIARNIIFSAMGSVLGARFGGGINNMSEWTQLGFESFFHCASGISSNGAMWAWWLGENISK